MVELEHATFGGLELVFSPLGYVSVLEVLHRLENEPIPSDIAEIFDRGGGVPDHWG